MCSEGGGSEESTGLTWAILLPWARPDFLLPTINIIPFSKFSNYVYVHVERCAYLGRTPCGVLLFSG